MTKTIFIKDKKPSLKELQSLVGGYIELVWDDGEKQIICNEEGKLFGLPYNEEATKIWKQMVTDNNGGDFYEEVDCLVGDIVILSGKAKLE